MTQPPPPSDAPTGAEGATTADPPPDPPPGRPTGPRTTSEEVRDLRRIRRTTRDRKVAGVAGGLGRHLDVDPVILRVAFVVLTFFGGAGLIAYAAGWLLLPEDDGSEAVIGLEDRTRGVVLAIVGIVAAASVVAELAGGAWAPFWFPWQLALVAVVAVVLLSRRDRSPGSAAPPPGTPYAGAPYAGSPSAPPPGTPWAGAAHSAGSSAPPVTAPYAGSSMTGWAAAPGAVPPAPAGVPVAPVPVARNPRRRGPVLFWFTLALVALAEGVLGTLDLAGAPVADAAYPALALAVVGAMLVVGAFFGRAGGLVLVGLVALPVLLVTAAVGEIEPDPVRETPRLAASVDDAYRFGAGELVLDLTEVEDLEGLDGRTVVVDVSVGRIEVVVPDGLSVDASAVVNGPGALTLFGEERSGIDTSGAEQLDAGDDAPSLTLDLETDLGEIVVRTR